MPVVGGWRTDQGSFHIAAAGPLATRCAVIVLRTGGTGTPWSAPCAVARGIGRIPGIRRVVKEFSQASRRSVLTGRSADTVLQEVNGMAAIKDQLWARLRSARSTILARVDGLSEYDLRRPLTPTGTNLLGLVKHLAGEEFGYLGEVFDRPPQPRPSWFRDDPGTEIDMWATPDEAAGYIVDTYRRAASHADATIRILDLDSPGVVPHWTSNQQTTLGAMLVLMVGETAQHAGHADIVRELIDGTTGPENIGGGHNRRSEVQDAADRFR